VVAPVPETELRRLADQVRVQLKSKA
jgi:hypothetical protein